MRPKSAVTGVRGWTTSELVLGLILILALSGMTCKIAQYRAFSRTRLVVRNATPGVLDLVEIVLERPGTRAKRHAFDQVEPGTEHAVPFEPGDLTVRMRFVTAGGEHAHREYVDLWSGETYRLVIGPDATVSSGYASCD